MTDLRILSAEKFDGSNGIDDIFMFSRASNSFSSKSESSESVVIFAGTSIMLMGTTVLFRQQSSTSNLKQIDTFTLLCFL